MLRDLITKYKIYLYLIGLTVIAYLPVGFGQSQVKPAIIVISIFYFSIIPQTRPALLFLIILGTFDDFLSNSTVGITSLNYVLISLIASSNTKALLEQRFNVVWVALFLALAIVNFIEALVLSVMNDYHVFKFEIAARILLSLLIYPLLHYFYSIKINWFRVK